MYKNAFEAKKGLNSHNSSTATKLQTKHIQDNFLVSNFPMDIIHDLTLYLTSDSILTSTWEVEHLK